MHALTGYHSPIETVPNTSWTAGFGAEAKSSIAIRGRIFGEAMEALERIVKGRGPLSRHGYLNRPVLAGAVERVGTREAAVRDTSVIAAFFDRLEAVVASCGARVVYLLTPVNPLLLHEPRYSNFATAHDAMADDIRARAGEAHIDLNRFVPFEPDDFRDWGHLRSEKRIHETTRVAAKVLAGLMTEEGNGP